MKLATKFKLLPTPEQKLFLSDYFSRFAKAVNFYAEKIVILRKEYQWITKKEQTRGKCGMCGKRATLTHKFLPTDTLICPKCYNSQVGDQFIRKKLYATKRGKQKRNRGKYDVKDAAKFGGDTEYSLSAKRAIDIIKSYKKQLAKIRGTIRSKERRLFEWQEVLDNKELKVTDLKRRYKNNETIQEVLNRLNTSKVFARFTLPRQEKQKVDRYKHVVYQKNNSRGRTEKQIVKEIEALEKTIEKLKKRLNETRIKFKGNIVDLQDTAVKDINEEFVELGIDGRRVKFAIAVASVKNDKGKDWLCKQIEHIKGGKLRYPLLSRNNSTYFLSYPTQYDLDEPTISNPTNVMGIDRGVKPHIAVSVILDKPKDKPHDIRFYSGEQLLKNKIKFQLISKKLTGTKSVNKRRSKFGKKVSRASEYLIHNISKDIVEQAKEFQPIVIVMENLDMVQGEKRPNRRSAKQEKKLNFLFSNFEYGDLQKKIEYKALKAGLPIRYVDPAYTSQLCYKCGAQVKRPKNRGFSECTKCKNKVNANLNAAVNVANALYKEIKS